MSLSSSERARAAGNRLLPLALAVAGIGLAGVIGVTDALGSTAAPAATVAAKARAKARAKAARKAKKRKDRKRSPSFAVCLDVQPRSSAPRVLASLEERKLPASATVRFLARRDAKSTDPDPCIGSYARKLDAWRSALALRRDRELAGAGMHILGHRVVRLPAGKKPSTSSAAVDVASLPGSSGARGMMSFADLGVLKRIPLEANETMTTAVTEHLRARPAGVDPALMPSVGVVVTGFATVFSATDPYLPPASMAAATLERFQRVLVVGGEFNCDDVGAACLYWHHIWYGETWRRGVIPSGHVVPASSGSLSRKGGEVAYLTPRARLPYTPGPFFREGKEDSPRSSDVYDVWMYKLSDGRMGRVDTVHLPAGARIKALEWSTDSDVILVMGGGSRRPLVRLEASLTPAKKYTYSKKKKKKKGKKKPTPPVAKPKPPRA